MMANDISDFYFVFPKLAHRMRWNGERSTLFIPEHHVSGFSTPPIWCHISFMKSMMELMLIVKIRNRLNVFAWKARDGSLSNSPPWLAVHLMQLATRNARKMLRYRKPTQKNDLYSCLDQRSPREYRTYRNQKLKMNIYQRNGFPSLNWFRRSSRVQRRLAPCNWGKLSFA